jgi:hypothetical protein
MEASRPFTVPDAVSPSASGGNSLGLSELSKQLRVLQAQNQSQSMEIERLERQLRILSDLQGVSVNDLRSALLSACQAEAHSELISRLHKLEAQLEAASLMASKKVPSNQVATLELRIGELEEIEANQREEIARVFEALQDAREKASRLEATVEQQAREIEQLRKTTGSAAQFIVSQRASVDGNASNDAAIAREAQVEAKVQSEKVSLLEQRLESTEKDHSLREAQFKARSMVQEEYIRDLEQQLSSLYVAFDMLKQERDAEEATRATLQNNLHEADAQVARQLTSPSISASHQSSMSLVTPNNSRASSERTESFNRRVSSSPLSNSRRSTALPAVSRRMKNSSPDGDSSVQELEQLGDCILQGTLLVRYKGVLKQQWRERSVALWRRAMHFELAIPEDRKFYKLMPGYTSVRANSKQHEYGMTIIYPNTTLCVAALDAASFQEWMDTLQRVVTGVAEEDAMPTVDLMEVREQPLDPEEAELQEALQRSKNDM